MLIHMLIPPAKSDQVAYGAPMLPLS